MEVLQMRILIAEEDKALGDGLADYLRERCGHTVTVTADSPSLQQTIQKTSYHIVLLSDKLPPQPSGVRLARFVKEHAPGTEVIVYTDQEMTSATAVLATGAYRYWAKPLDFEEVGIILQRVGEQRQLRGAARQNHILAELMATSTALLSGKSVSEILETILEGMQTAVGFDRVRLYLLAQDGFHLVGKAAVGMEVPFVGLEYKPDSNPYLPSLNAKSKLQIFRRPDGERLAYDDILDSLDVDERVYIPLIVQQEVVGLMVADNKYSQQAVDLDELRTPLTIFAAQAAAAIHNGRLMEQEHQRAEQLESLQQTTLALTSERDRNLLLHDIIERAVKLLSARSGGIKIYYPDRECLEVVATYGRPDNAIGRMTPVGQGMAGRIIQTGESYLTVSNYPEWADHLEYFAREAQLESVIAVKLAWQDHTIGVLYLDDVLGRVFTEQDANLLRLFADQAAVAYVNAELTDKDASQLRRLERLPQVINKLMSDLASMSLTQRLNLIVSYAAEILDAEACGIWLKQDEVLTLAADFGFAGTKIPIGHQVAVHGDEKGGLTGYIAHMGKLFNAHGSALKSHVAVKGEVPSQTGSGACYSLLVVPICRRSGQDERVVGLLRVENKKDGNGQTGAHLKFSVEDETTLQIFAEAVAVALESAELVGDLRESKAHFSRLIASSPIGVIANSRHGIITDFNQRAQEIIGYAPDEILGNPVEMLYANPQEAGVVGKMLHESPNGRVTDYETAVTSRDGAFIPIRLSATLLQDAQNNNIGTVGYFEDFRLIREARGRLELILAASKLLASADDLRKGLRRLAKMMVQHWHVAFARVFLLDEDNETLRMQAVYPPVGSKNGWDWQPEVGMITAVSDWPDLRRSLNERDSFVLNATDSRHQPTLVRWGELVHLSQEIQSLLVVPLRTRDKIVGLIDFGELTTSGKTWFADDQKRLAIAVARQAAILIDRFHFFESASKAKKLLQASYEASNSLVSSQDPEHVLRDMIEETLVVAGADGVRLFMQDAVLGPVDVITAESGKLDVTGLVRSDGLTMRVIRNGRYEAVTNVQQELDRVNPSFLERGIAAALGLPVAIEGQTIGVLWIYYSQPRYFSQDEIEVRQLYANQAAIAYDNARRLKATEQVREAASVLAGADSLEEVLQEAMNKARQVLYADSVAIWSYDDRRDKYILPESIASGIPDELWHAFQQSEPNQGGRVDNIMERGWVSVENVASAQEDTILGESTRQRLLTLGVQSYQGVALRVGDDKLGVLFANYKRQRPFSERDRKTAETFAHHLALALKNAKLVQQLRKVQETTGFIARVSTLANLDETLDSVAQGMKDVLGCDVVTLHVYDQDRNRLKFPPTMKGAHYPREVSPTWERIKGFSLVLRILQSGRKVYVADDVYQDELFQDSRFTKAEEIASCTAVSLQVRSEKVGVMFVNYRTPHRFTGDELATIVLFADQAAVAIHNSRLYQHEKEQAIALLALDAMDQVAQGKQNLVDEIWFAIAKQATYLTGTHGVGARNSHLALVENNKLVFKAMYPREKLAELQETVGPIDLVADEVIGVTGRAVVEKRPIYESDVKESDTYLFYHPETRSELAVPIVSGDEVIGAINVEHPYRDAFDSQDIQALNSLAAYAAIAIKNAQLFGREQRQTRALLALNEATKAVTRSLNLKEILDHIAVQAYYLTSYDKQQAVYTSIWLLEGETLARVMATYPKEELALTQAVIGGEVMDWQVGVDGRMGVVGRTIKKQKVTLVVNVIEDADYVASHPETRSELAVPMMLDKELLGVINVEHEEFNAFTGQDIRALETLAAQAAIAIKNSREYAETKILQEVAASLAGSLEIVEVLNLVMKAALRLTGTESGSIVFWDEEHERYYPCYTTEGADHHLIPYQATSRPKQGYAWQIMQENRSVTVSDLRQDKFANPTQLAKGRHCFVGVPLVADTGAPGALFVHGTRPRQFSQHQVTVLETLANAGSVAIEKARQHEELKETKGMVGARTALAWMGMASAAWRHSIEGHAANIRAAMTVLQPKLFDALADEPDLWQYFQEKFALIDNEAQEVLQKPITTPLRDEESNQRIILNDLIYERMTQLWRDEPYQSVEGPHLHLEETTNRVVWGSLEWLRLALDLVVDNAVEAMQKSAVRRLTITTYDLGHRVDIAIQDSGPGIDLNILPHLFKELPDRPGREGHLGRGLLMVQAIMQTYRGDIRVGDTGSNGTTMLLSLPLSPE